MEKLLTLCCLLLSIVLIGQDYILEIQHYGVEEGLSHRDVHAIHQDEQGILWLGTSYGLNRFDGYQFKWYTRKTHGLQSNRITHVLQDAAGLLWLFDTEAHFVQNIRTLCLFDPKLEKKYAFEEFFAGSIPFSLDMVAAFAANEQGELVFITNDRQIVIYDGQWKKFDLESSDYQQVFELRWAPNGWLWLISDDGSGDISAGRRLQAFDTNGIRQQEAVHKAANALHIQEIDADGNCRYLTSSAKTSQLHTLGTDGNQGADLSIENPFLEAFLQNVVPDQAWSHPYISTGRFYLLSVDVSLYLFTPNGMVSSEQDPELRKITSSARFHLDSLGHIWAINAFGLYRIHVEENKFKRLFHNPGSGRFATRGLCTDDAGQLWVIQEGITQLWKANLLNDSIGSLNQSLTVQDKIPMERPFNAIIKNHSGKLQFATTSQLTNFDPISLNYQTNDLGKSNSQTSAMVWAMQEDQSHKIWMATSTGEYGFWHDQKMHWLGALDTIHSPHYGYQFYEDREGLFWLATDRGLFLLDNKTGAVEKRYWSGGNGELAFPFDHIHHLYEDKDGSFWLATAGMGLVHWNKGNPLLLSGDPGTTELSPIVYEQFTRADGLNNVLYAVYEDESACLWMSSDNGIIRFNKETKQINTYLEADGITHHEFNRISHHQSADGRLYFGGLYGVTAFYPRDFVADSTSNDASLVITNLQIFDDQGLPQ